MTNLVSRLRDWKGNDFGPYRSPVPDLLEAADEIERLERALWLAYEKSRNDDEQIRDYAARLSAEPTAKPDKQGFPMDARVRSVWEKWEGKVVSAVTHYEIQLDDGTFKQNVHSRDLEPTERTGESQ